MESSSHHLEIAVWIRRELAPKHWSGKLAFFGLLNLGLLLTALGLVLLNAPLTDDTFLELCFAVILPAIGSAIVFNIGAYSRGTHLCFDDRPHTATGSSAARLSAPAG